MFDLIYFPRAINVEIIIERWCIYQIFANVCWTSDGL